MAEGVGTDIVQTRDELLDQEEVIRELDRLEQAGDTTTLNEVARQAAAHQEYETRNKATERANYFGRIKVMAEARIGHIDLALNPVKGADPLVFGDFRVPYGQRSQWRSLGVALRIGALDRAMNVVEGSGDTVSTTLVYRELNDSGLLWVSTAPLLKHYRDIQGKQKLTIREVASRAGLSPSTVNNILVARTKSKVASTRCRRQTAIRIAQAINFDEKLLTAAYRHNRPAVDPKRRQRKQRPLPGGRLDETYVLIRRALQELDRAGGPDNRWGTEEAYLHLYEAEDIIGRALRRAT